MKSLLCGLISIALLVNSATPALAGILPVGRATSRAVSQTTKAAARMPALLNGTTVNFSKQTAHVTAHTQALEAQTLRQVSRIQQSLSKNVQYQKWFEQSKLSTLAKGEKSANMAQRIFSLPQAKKEPLLRNEFVLLSLTQQVSLEELTLARNFFRTDLAAKQAAFKTFSGQPLDQILTTQTPAMQACQEAFADAAALALTGEAQDAAALIAFHQAAVGTAFEPAATRLVGRGLLRLGDYQAFNQWIEPLKQQGEFWVGLTVYARQHHLPVSLSASLGEKTPAESVYLTTWLEKGNLANGLNASGSLEATQRWMELGAAQPMATAPAAGVQPAIAVKPNLNQVADLIPSKAEEIVPSDLPQTKEEPGLHDNDVRPVYEEPQTLQPQELEADDMLALAEGQTELEVAESGFKLSFADKKNNEELLRNVNLTIDTALETEGYNRVVLRSDNIFELRNGTKPAGKMSHFIFTLSNEHGELYQVAQAVSKLSLYRPMRIKLERKPNARYTPVFLDVVDFDSLQSLNMQAIVDSELLPKGAAEGNLLLARDGNVYFMSNGETPVLLEGFYVRLPKGEAPIWMKALQSQAQTDFNLKLVPTDNKVNFLTYVVPLLRIGTGKAFGPIMSSLGFSPFLATGIPLFANNGLPLLLGPLMPMLRRNGDANMYRLGVGFYATAFTGALMLGLNGFMMGGAVSPMLKYGLPGVLLAAGFGGALINTPQNNLIRKNAGVIQSERQKAKGWVGDKNAEPTISYLAKRVKEIFTTKNTEMRDSVRYQLASAVKNVGTFGFLALPFFFNSISKALGTSLHADFSLSFVPFSGLALYALYKVLKMPLKDTAPRNTAVLHNMVVEAEHNLTPMLEQTIMKPQAEWDFKAISKQLHGVLTPYARGLSYKFKRKQADVVVELEEQSLNRLKSSLTKNGVSEATAQEALTGLQQSLAALGRRDVSLWNVLKMPGVLPALSAMTMLTVHELGTSSEFAYQVNELAKLKFGMEGDGGVSALGMFLTAFFLYGTSFFSRLAGNWLALRTSEGSMYAFSSAMSVLGSSLLIAADGSLPLLFTGATMATFGMGNFFSQVFEYTTKQAPKFRQELAVLIGYTMPLAAGLSACVHSLAEWGVTQGVQDLGLMATLGALLVSFVMCPGIFADSSVIRSAQYYGKKAWTAVKNMFHKPQPPASPASAVETDPLPAN